MRLRRFLLLLSGAMCTGTVVELLLIGHTDSWVQIVPLVAAGVGVVAPILILRVHREPAVGPLRYAFRSAMLCLIIVSIVGVFQHVRANYLFVREIKPAGTAGDAFVEALSGASPLLASGILAIAGVCGWMATVRSATSTENQDSVR